LLLGNGPRTQSCKAIGIDKEDEKEEVNGNDKISVPALERDIPFRVLRHFIVT
jgi:hypothetical protein